MSYAPQMHKWSKEWAQLSSHHTLHRKAVPSRALINVFFHQAADKLAVVWLITALLVAALLQKVCSFL